MRKPQLIAAGCALLLTGMPGAAKDATGFLTGSNAGLSAGIYHMPLTGPGAITVVKPYSFALHGGAYGDHSYWLLIGDDTAGNMMEGLWIMDPDTGEIRRRVTMPAEFGCTDMTYDYATGDLLGILCHKAGTQVAHELVRIDSYAGYQSVATLDNKYMALASDLWGTVYAMGANGSLYRLDPATGNATLVGATGLVAAAGQSQSMEVDRDSGELYWSFIDSDEVVWLAKIDPATGTVLEKHTVDQNALLGALYIPFTEVTTASPNAAVSLSASPQEEDVVLSWTAPASNLNGTPLEDNLRTEIRRNGVLVKTLEDVAPGTPCSWTDAGAPQGVDLTYAVSCWNGALRGATAFARTHTGPDVPAPVDALAATAADGCISLAWTAPCTDRNGRELDPQALSYRVSRTPAAKEWTVSGTSFTDTEIEQANTYVYSVNAVNNLGAGEARTTEPVMGGPAVRMPWYPDLNDQFSLTQFNITNANNDGFTWYDNNGKYTIQNIYGAADDWLITVPLHLEEGMRYRLGYTMETATGTMTSAESFSITLGSDLSPQSQTRLIRQENAFNEKRRDFTDEITVEATGDYTLGIHCDSNSWEAWALSICNISIEPVGAVDLMVQSLTGPAEPEVGAEALYLATVTNHGTEEQTGFEVLLLDQEGNTLARTVSAETIEPDTSAEVQLAWTPANGHATALRAKVVKEGDINAANDMSAPLSIRFLNPGQAIVTVGVHDSDPGLFPFNFQDLFSLCETIYSATEIDSDGGMISEISWTYDNPGATLTGKHVKVYMANTSKSYVVREFDMPETLALVYDGQADFLAGRHTLRLALTDPFPYSGGNLMVVTEKLQDIQTGLRVTFAGQKFENTPRTLVTYNSSGHYQPDQGYVSDIMPCIGLVLDSEGGTSLSGTVTASGSPVGSAVVSLRGKNTETRTDYRGRYSIGWIPAGDYTVDADPNYYIYLEGNGTARCAAGTPATLDIELQERPSASLRGTVTDSEGRPVEGAAVEFTGWERHTAVTDTEGKYSFEKLYQHPGAGISVYATGCKAFNEEREYAAETPATADFTLEVVHNPVRQATVTPCSGSSPLISWTPVDFGYEIANDNDEPSGSYQTPVAGLFQLGKAFAGPTAVSSVKWHSAGAASLTAGTVAVRIYALSENGAPGSLLYEDEDVPAYTGWTTYHLSETVSSPYGVLVSIGSEGMLSISTDSRHIAGSYILDAMSGSYAPLSDNTGALNLMIRLHAARFNPLAGYIAPQVAYNLYRLDATASEADYASHTLMVQGHDGSQCQSTDPDWERLPEARYSYAVEPVFTDGYTAPRTFTAEVEKKPVSLTSTDDGSLHISTAPGLLTVTAHKGCELAVYTTDGVCIFAETAAPGAPRRIPLPPGIYTLRADDSVRKLLIK